MAVSTISTQQIRANAVTAAKVASDVIVAAGTNAFTADQPLGGFKLTNLGTPTANGDAANKSYVDTLVNGLDWKASVRAATTVAGTLASSFENLDVIDGVTLATGDRILLKDQAAGAENGIYTVNASGAPTRATDADASAEVTSGLAVFITEGTANGNTQWALNTDDPITLGTTALTFGQVGAGTTYSAGTGLTLTGTVFAADFGSTSGKVTQGNDSRLSDARTPVGTALSSAQVFVGSSGNLVAAVTLSGDVAITNAGVATVANQVRLSKVVTRETPGGTVNGSNDTFTLAATPVSGTESVFVNGLLQDSGAGNDYTISGLTITFLTGAIPQSGDKIRVSSISQ